MPKKKTKKSNKKSTSTLTAPSSIMPIAYYATGGYLPYEQYDTPEGTGTDDLTSNLGEATKTSSGVDIGAVTNISSFVTDQAAEAIGTGDKDAATWGGAVSGAGSGAAMGSSFGPWGALVGAVVGGAYGAYTGSENYQEGADLRRKQGSMMEAENPIRYVGAYGGKLPQYFNGGILPTGGETDPPPSMIDNPNYAAQQKLYQQSLTNRPQESLSATMDDQMLQKWVAHRNKEFPNLSQLGINKVVYDPNTVDANTGLPSQFLDYYDAPPRQIQAPQTAPTPATPALPRMLDATTGKPLDPNDYPPAEGQIGNRQYSQYLEQFANSPEQRAKREQEAATLATRKTELSNMSEEEKRMERGDLTTAERIELQRQEFMKANQRAEGGFVGDSLEMGGDATEYNGNTHENGGIQVGNSEVEDGEIRVGDYVFSDRLTNAEGKTFSDAAKAVVKKYEEYQNDGPSMRTQDKKLKELSFENDQARLLKRKEEAMQELVMMEGFKAYGGHITKDEKGKYNVPREQRKAIMDTAKANKMSYNKYIDSVYCYGGKMNKQSLAGGGKIGDDGIIPSDSYPPELQGLTSPSAEAMMSFSGSDITRPGYVAPNEINTLPTKKAEPIASDIKKELARLPLFNTGDVETDKENKRLIDNIGREDLALLASNLPAMGNLMGSMQSNKTNFERLNLEDINLDAERAEVRKSADQARRQHRYNVRGTASSAGEALAGLSAGTAGITGKELDAISRINAQERNINTQQRNQEALTNVGISQQETIARQQDEAMKASMKSAATSDISSNVQGYLKDKSLTEENEAYNKRLMSLLDTGEYKVVEDEEGGYKVIYAGKPTVADKTNDEESKKGK